MTFKKTIAKQKAEARKLVASDKIKNTTQAADETAFLEYDFVGIDTADKVLDIIHKMRHDKLGIEKSACELCKKIAEEIQQEQQIADILPRMGNLLAVLEQEVAEEKVKIESKQAPSPNDLTRWALRDAVLSYYQGFNYPDDKPIVESRYDDRLIDELAPDFDVIYKIWLQKLDELKRRNDKFTLGPDEVDKAEADLVNGMRGSAFEKALDRFRIDFMAKLPK